VPPIERGSYAFANFSPGWHFDEPQDTYTNTGPPTTQAQVYRQVREYRDRYPNIALLPMENGAGPLPILMAGAASPSSLRAPESHQDALSTDTTIDKFVRNQLADDLMKLEPVEGVVADPGKIGYSRAAQSTQF
jgi:hypothetical protein